MGFHHLLGVISRSIDELTESPALGAITAIEAAALSYVGLHCVRDAAQQLGDQHDAVEPVELVGQLTGFSTPGLNAGDDDLPGF